LATGVYFHSAHTVMQEDGCVLLQILNVSIHVLLVAVSTATVSHTCRYEIMVIGKVWTGQRTEFDRTAEVFAFVIAA
jgi:hypothetical protein